MNNNLASKILICLSALTLSACTAFSSQTDEQKTMALFTKAQQAYSEGMLEEAEAGFNKVTKLNPNFYEAWLRLGNIYVRTGQLKAAERMFETSARINPTDYKAWNNLAITYIKQAIAILKEANEHMKPGSAEEVASSEMAIRLIVAITNPNQDKDQVGTNTD